MAVDDEAALALLGIKVDAVSGNCSFCTQKKDVAWLFRESFPRAFSFVDEVLFVALLCEVNVFCSPCL